MRACGRWFCLCFAVTSLAAWADDPFVAPNGTHSPELPSIGDSLRFEEMIRPLPPVEDDIVSPLLEPSSLDRFPSFDFGPTPDPRPPVRFGLFTAPAASLKNQPGSLAMSGEEAALGFPLLIRENTLWLALANVKRLELNAPFRLPDTNASLPNQLWNLDFGGLFLHKFANDHQAGTMLTFGSPSDVPFGGIDNVTMNALGFYRFPAGERDAWIISLYYSPTGQVTFPIPGLAYAWHPSERLQANLGVPFSLKYIPWDSCTITAGYIPLTNFNASVRQKMGESWTAYATYRIVNEIYLFNDRIDTHQRSIFYDQRLSLGIQRTLTRGWSLDLSAGYLWDRKYFEARKFTADRTNEVAIDPGLIYTIQLTWNR